MSDFSFFCIFVLGSEKSTDGTFVPVELSFRGTFAPWNSRSCGTFVPRKQTFQELSLPGTFAPSAERIGYSKNFRSKHIKQSKLYISQ